MRVLRISKKNLIFLKDFLTIFLLHCKRVVEAYFKKINLPSFGLASFYTKTIFKKVDVRFKRFKFLQSIFKSTYLGLKCDIVSNQ